MVHAGGRSGGIAANIRYPAELMYDNLMATANVMHADVHGARKLLYLASSCSYPRLCPQPMTRTSSSPVRWSRRTSRMRLAKLAGWKLCQAYRRQYGDDFIVAIPANSYGIGDDFSPEGSHVIGAPIRRAQRGEGAGHSRP